MINLYLVTIVGGAAILLVVVGGLHSLLDWELGSDKEEETGRVWWVAMLAGMVERASVTTLMLFAPGSLTPFIGGWMILKLTGGWGLIKSSSKRGRSTYFIGLIGSVISIGWALWMTAVWYPDTLLAFAPTLDPS